MDKTAASLMADIEAMEKKLASAGRPAKSASRDVTARREVLAEIAALEKRIAEDDDDEADDEMQVTAGDEESEEAFDAEDAPVAADDKDDMPEGMTASESAPGIEDEITQDKFTEVEDLRHGEELTTGPSMHDVAGYTARLKEASVRLDRVAEYLEKHGRKTLAYRLDKIADAIDAQLKNAEEDDTQETEEA